jgi:hypothetical protein
LPGRREFRGASGGKRLVFSTCRRRKLLWLRILGQMA